MDPKFKAFNEHTPVDVYHRSLPHWRQEGATYFTTFRLADSIPRALLAQWNHEREIWLEANGVLKVMNQSERATAYAQIDEKRRKNFERANSRRLFSELDQCHGSCLLEQKACRSIARDAMLHFDGQRYHAGNFVIMPNHVHWIIQPLQGHTLETILQSIKRFSSTQLTKQGLKDQGRLWQSESHDHLIRDRNELERIRKYIRENPRKASLSEDRYSLHQADWLSD
jgi:putative transposase